MDFKYQKATPNHAEEVKWAVRRDTIRGEGGGGRGVEEGNISSHFAQDKREMATSYSRVCEAQFAEARNGQTPISGVGRR